MACTASFTGTVKVPLLHVVNFFLFWDLFHVIHFTPCPLATILPLPERMFLMGAVFPAPLGSRSGVLTLLLALIPLLAIIPPWALIIISPRPERLIRSPLPFIELQETPHSIKGKLGAILVLILNKLVPELILVGW